MASSAQVMLIGGSCNVGDDGVEQGKTTEWRHCCWDSVDEPVIEEKTDKVLNVKHGHHLERC